MAALIHCGGLFDPFWRPVSTAIPPLIVVALVAAVAFAAAGIWAALEVGKAARSSRRLAEDLDERVVPLTDKLDVSVDAFNAELLRVDGIVDQLEGAVDRFSGTAETVREVVDAPIHLVSEVAERFRRGLKRRGPHQRERTANRADRLDEAPAQVMLAEVPDEPVEEPWMPIEAGIVDTVPERIDEPSSIPADEHEADESSTASHEESEEA